MIIAIAGTAVLLVAADAAVGAAAQDRAPCRVVEGVTVRADLAALPVTSGVFAGSIGTAQVHVPWSVAADRLGDGSTASDVTLSAEEGAVVARTEIRGLLVSVTMLPDVAGSGELVLTPATLSVGGREVPAALAGMVAGRDAELLGPRVVPLDGAGVASGAHVESVAVGEDGLDLSLRLPLAALSRPGGAGQACPAE